MAAYTFTIKQHDRRPVLRANLRNGDKTPLDLSGASGVTFTMKKNATVKINKSTASVIDATNGIVEYSWGATDTDTLGTYKGEFEITWSSSVTQTLPDDDYIQINIIKDLA